MSVDSKLLTPDTAVEPFAQQVEQGSHRHVKKEEAHKTAITEEPKQRIHPDPN